MLLDIMFVEHVWVCLRRNHNNSSVVIQMTGILDETISFGLDFIVILLLLMNLHEIQIPVMWQIECFVPIYNAVHNARICGQFRKIYIKLFTCMYMTWYTCTFDAICTLK